MSDDELNRLKQMVDAATKKTKTTTMDKTIDDVGASQFANFADPTSKGSLSRSDQQKTTYSDKQSDKQSDKTQATFRKASAQTTRNKTATITPTKQMIDQLSKLDTSQLDDEDDDYPDLYPKKPTDVAVTITNLPSVAQTAIANVTGVDPEFHQVSSLPGNMKSVIRRLGKGIFKEFTSTPTDQIYVVADLMGQGPNTTKEVNAVANWILRNGQPITGGRMDFNGIMPGYETKMGLYRAAGIDWMVIQDFAGKYIYTWPSDQTHITSSAKKMLGNKK